MRWCKKKLFVICIAAVFSVCFAGCTKSVAEQIREQLELGNQYLLELDYENAIVAFEKVIELEERNVEARLALGQAYEGIAAQMSGEDQAAVMEQYARAADYYEQVLELDSGQEEAYMRLVDIYPLMGQPEKVLDLSERFQPQTGSAGDIEKELEMLRNCHEIAEELTEACEAEDYNQAAALMRDDRFQDMKSFLTSLEKPVYMADEETGMGIYPAESPVFQEDMLYYGTYEEGKREGRGVLISYSDLGTYHAAGQWKDDHLVDSLMEWMDEEGYDSTLDAYASQQNYLYGKTCTGYLTKNYDIGFLGYDISDIPITNIGYKVHDFDNDGKMELLIISIDQTYAFILSIYENHNGIVNLSAQLNLGDEGFFLEALPAYEDSVPGLIDIYVYNGNHIAIEMSELVEVVADGLDLRFISLIYQDSSISIEGKVSWEGSYGWPDTDYSKTLYNLNIRNVDIRKLMRREKYIGDYVNNYRGIACINTIHLLTYEEWAKWHDDSDDPIACSTISFYSLEDISNRTFEHQSEYVEPAENNLILQSYKTALERFRYNYEWPDGEMLEYVTGIEENRFAICDIDNDSVDELILEFSTTYTAAMRESVFQFDTDSGLFISEFRGTLDCHYYDNGYILMNASHNHTNSDFWPFDLYQYDLNTDSYVFKGSVYAFDQWYTPYATERFPTEIDQDHNGRVFYYSETERRPQDIEPVDDGAYQQWIDAHIGNAVEINVPWQNTSLENIEAILSD